MRRLTLTLASFVALVVLAGCNLTPPTPVTKPVAKPAATGPAAQSTDQSAPQTAPQGALPPAPTPSAGVVLTRTAATAPPAAGAPATGGLAPTTAPAVRAGGTTTAPQPIASAAPPATAAPPAAGNQQPPALSGILTGTVSYRERVALQPDNIVTIRLLDVSRQDAPSITLAEQVITNAKGVPVAYTLKYDPKKVDPKNTYSVSANIRDGAGKLLWVTDTRYAALTNGAPVTDINLILRSATATSQTTAQNALTGLITGTVTYREKVALPPNSVVTVQLQDVSLADAPAKVLSQQVISGVQSVPVPFELSYDAAGIEARNTYILRAEIRNADKLLWTTDKSYPVLTNGAPTSGVEIVLVRVAEAGQPSTSTAISPTQPVTPLMAVALPVIGGKSGVTATSEMTAPVAMSPTTSLAGRLSGTLTYRERIALPQGAAYNVSLFDVTNPSSPQLVVSQDFGAAPSVPLPFTLAYPVQAIAPQALYEVRASISAGGRPVFNTPTERLALVDAAELAKGSVNAGELMLVTAAPLPARPVTETAMITGTVTYREKIALPQGAVLTVSLYEVNARNVAGRLVERATSFADGQVPLPFELKYDPSKISKNKRYGLFARITAGTSVWTNARGAPVLTFNAPDTGVEILTRKTR